MAVLTAMWMVMLSAMYALQMLHKNMKQNRKRHLVQYFYIRG